MSLNVLLIEPDKVLGNTYQTALEQAEMVVVCASSAEAALQSLESTKPDVIILEPQLVGHGGFEFLYELRSYSDWQNIPVVLHTMIPQQVIQYMQASIKQLGVVGCLYKPRTKLKQLVDEISDLLIARADV